MNIMEQFTLGELKTLRNALQSSITAYKIGWSVQCVETQQRLAIENAKQQELLEKVEGIIRCLE